VKQAFTLIELIVVVAIISILVTLVAPAVRSVQETGKRSKCSHNLRQLYLANKLYAVDYGHYVAAAEGMNYGKFNPGPINCKRWHGERDAPSQPFDGTRGPLVPYLGEDESIRACPSLKNVHQNSPDAFEQSCGGYGYNDAGVGSRAYQYGYNSRADAKGTFPGTIRHAAQTVMFTDAAFLKNGKLIEYSFSKPYYQFKSSKSPDGSVESSGVWDPSIHFRHRGKANVVWCDGHISCEEMTVAKSAEHTKNLLGWFGEENNELFDPY